MTNKEYRFELHPARLRSGKDSFVLWQATGHASIELREASEAQKRDDYEHANALSRVYD